MNWWIIVALILVALVIFGIIDSMRQKKQMRETIEKQFGTDKNITISEKRYAFIDAYAKSMLGRTYDIDDITWNDLEMDSIFRKLNQTNCSVGEEYLYAALRRPEFYEDELKRREELTQLFSDNAALRVETQMALSKMGRMKNVSLYKYLTCFDGVTPGHLWKHLIPSIGYLAGILLCCFNNVTLGIGLMVLVFFYGIIEYYKRKAEIDPYMQAMTYVSTWMENAIRLSKLEGAEDTALKPELAALKECTDEFRNFRRGSWLLGSSNPSGDLMQTILDYIKMFLHLDLIQFDRMNKILQDKTSELRNLFEVTGRIDMAVSTASYRKIMEGKWCRPELSQEATELSFQDLCHPLIGEPVPNSLTTGRSILLTGSNASGKSTFLKTVAVNAILAQTINTVIGTSYKGQFYRIMSSMALRDDLAAKESYYIVEIRSLKRILDAAEEEEPVLCFVDEVLRGTNTAERIASSSRILQYLSENGALCFAATHDLELTSLLQKWFSMYHFCETVTSESLTFDYLLKEGKATSRNAILLLKLFGYPECIIEDANNNVEQYLNRQE